MFRHDTDDGRCYSYVQPTCCVSNISCLGFKLGLIPTIHSLLSLCNKYLHLLPTEKKSCVGTKLGGLKPGTDPNSKCSELLFEFPIETWAMPQCTNTTNCRPKFRFPSTRISFAVHTPLPIRNHIQQQYIALSPKKILKVGSR